MKSPGQAAREAYIHMRPEDYSEHDFWDAIAQAAIEACDRIRALEQATSPREADKSR